MQNYRQGDKICLFGRWSFPNPTQAIHLITMSGFSRGAYTARALAGLLFKVCAAGELKTKSKLKVSTQIGLLPRDNEEQIPFAYRLYQRTDKLGCQLAAGYKQTFCTPVTIDFVGVWCVPPACSHAVGALMDLQGYCCQCRVTLRPQLTFHHKQRGDKGVQARAVP